MTERAAASIERLETRARQIPRLKHVLTLAEAVSLAARIEPELVRAMRLELLPGVEAGVEADLWFSPLVQSQSPQMLVLKPDVVEILRARLAARLDEPTGLKRAYAVVKRVHANAPSAIQIEEDLTYIALAPGSNDEKLKQAEDKLQAIAAAMKEGKVRGTSLAYWAARALALLPAEMQDAEWATAIAVGSDALLGGQQTQSRGLTLRERWDMLARVLPQDLMTEPVRVRFLSNGVEIGGSDSQAANEMPVPKMDPLMLELGWLTPDGSTAQVVVRCKPGESHFVPLTANEVTLKTVLGQVYTLRKQIVQPPSFERALHFDLSIERDGEGYAGRVNSPAGEAKFNFQLPFAPSKLDEWMLRMEGRVGGFEASQSAVQSNMPNAVRSTGAEAAKQFGGMLFDALFKGGQARELYLQSRESAREKNVVMDLRLELGGAPELEDVPWECLYDAERDQFLALGGNLPIIRLVPQPSPSRPLTATLPLRILVVISSPSIFPPLDAEREFATLREALANAQARGLVVLERVQDGTMQALESQLRRGGYHILHFIGHGGVDEDGQQAVLYLEDAESKPVRVTAESLGRLAANSRLMQLVVLNTRESSRTSRAAPYARFASGLVRQGLPAVVSTQFEIGEQAEATFAREFYGGVAAGRPVLEALSETRKTLFGTSDGVEWATPVISTFSPDLVLFDLKKPVVEKLTRRVLAIQFNPIVDGKNSKRLFETLGWNPPEQLIAQFSADINECSKGNVEYQVVQTLVADELPAKQDGFRYKPQEYIETHRQKIRPHEPDMADYQALLRQFNILDRIAKDEIDEVWLFGGPFLGFYESVMGGAGAFFCNAPPLEGTKDVPRRFVIMGYNCERGVGEMLESFGHRAEHILARVYGAELALSAAYQSNAGGRSQDNFFARFIRCEITRPQSGLSGGWANVGTLHHAPNSVFAYQWGNSMPVPSCCDDWLKFPNLPDPPVYRAVTASDWGGGDIREHHKWWLKHLPKAAGDTSGISNNWWSYVVDPGRVQFGEQESAETKLSPEQEQVQAAARQVAWMPVDPTSGLYEYARNQRFGHPITPEFGFTYGGTGYVGQMFTGGLVYSRAGTRRIWTIKQPLEKQRRPDKSADAAIAAARDYTWLPINPNSALYRFGQFKGMGDPQSDEFDFVFNDDSYIGQVFTEGIAYVKKGDWSNVRQAPKPEGGGAGSTSGAESPAVA